MMSGNASELSLPRGAGVDRPAHTVAIFDVGMADYGPLQSSLARLGASSFCTAHRIEMLEAAALIIPDGPSCEDYARVFSQKRLGQIIERRISGGRPVLACGTAMHMLCDGVDMGGAFITSPAPQWDGVVVELPCLESSAEVRIPIVSPLLTGVNAMTCEAVPLYALRTDPTEGMDSGPLTPPRIAWVGPPTPYVAAIDNGVLCGIAWAPESAGALGMRLLSNWLSYTGIVFSLPAEGLQ